VPLCNIKKSLDWVTGGDLSGLVLPKYSRLLWYAIVMVTMMKKAVLIFASMALLAQVVAQVSPPTPSKTAPKPAVPPRVILQQDIAETSVSEWQAVGGEGGKIEFAKGVFTGGGDALAMSYPIAKGKPAVLFVKGFGDKALQGTNTLKLSLRASETATYAVTLDEVGGGNWATMVHLEKDTWQEVVLPISEFILTEGPNDRPDGNGRLDIERVQSLSLVNMRSILGQVASPFLELLFAQKPGTQTLYLARLVATDATNISTLDGLNLPQIGWFPAGETKLSLTPTATSPLKSKSLRVGYTVGGGQVGVLFRRVRKGSLTASTGIGWNIASENATTLTCQVEDSEGGKFKTEVKVSGDKTPGTTTVKWSQFTPADDSKSKREKPDPAKITQIAFIDITGFTEGASKTHTLWLSGLAVTK
jgi:hypothetical protein